MARCIMLTGVTGSGKTTLGRYVEEILGIQVIDYADLMLAVINSGDKDELQALPWVKRREVYDQVEVLLEKMMMQPYIDRIVIENHLTIIQDEEILNFKVEDYEKYKLSGLCVVEADQEDIFYRRKHDNSRKRRLDTPTLIGEQQRANWQEALRIHRHYNIPLLRLNNETGNPPFARLVEWLRGLPL